MDRLYGDPFGVAGSSKEVCGVKTATLPSRMESELTRIKEYHSISCKAKE